MNEWKWRKVKHAFSLLFPHCRHHQKQGESQVAGLSVCLQKTTFHSRRLCYLSCLLNYKSLVKWAANAFCLKNLTFLSSSNGERAFVCFSIWNLFYSSLLLLIRLVYFDESGNLLRGTWKIKKLVLHYFLLISLKDTQLIYKEEIFLEDVQWR